MMTTEGRKIGRAKNAAMSYLERNLIVPKIYVDADWGDESVDILAIDRDGVGEVHAILFFQCRYDDALGRNDERLYRLNQEHYTRSIDGLLDRLSLIQANYKYVGVVGSFHDLPGLAPHMALQLETRYLFPNIPEVLAKAFSQDGLGRVGLLAIDSLREGDADVRVDVKPERFRAKIAKLADEYVQQHEADWEIRA